MTNILKIDRALYEVDDTTQTYQYYGRNPDWKPLRAEENERNKKHLDGNTRIIRNGTKKVFRYKN